MFFLYRIITILTIPFIRLYIYYRKYKGKEDPLRLQERFGYASKARPIGKLIWLHTVSVGEIISITPLLEGLRLKYPDVNLLVTTVTITAAKIFESKIKPSDKIFHQYFPVDDIFSVQRFLSHWKPDLFLPIESEIWPNVLHYTKTYCPIVLFNARMSSRSFAKWSKYGKFVTAEIFSYFDLILAQSLTDQQHLAALSGKKIEFVGNLKYSALPLSADPMKLAELKGQIGERPILLAASTHAGEEEIIATIYKELKKNYADLLLIIAPRHTTRTDELMQSLSYLQLNITIRSKQEMITTNTDLYIADTLGELGIFYSLANIAFIGGTLIPIGGHNPIEAVKLGCFVIMGPYTQNFTEICQELTQKNMLITCEKEQLYEVVMKALANQSQVGHDHLIEEMMNSGQHILDEMLARIDKFINPS